MKKIKIILAALAIAVMSVAPTAWANSLTFQDVTFNLTTNGTILTLGVSSPGITAATGGDWFGVNGFAAFEVKDIGTASGLALTGWTVTDNSLAANGCINGNTTGGCFVRNAGPVSFTAGNAFNFTFNITKTSGTFDLTNNSLKVIFTTNGSTAINSTCSNNQVGDCVTGKTGSLLSQNIPSSVPEPASLMLLGAGLAGVGILRRKSVKI